MNIRFIPTTHKYFYILESIHFTCGISNNKMRMVLSNEINHHFHTTLTRFYIIIIRVQAKYKETILMQGCHMEVVCLILLLRYVPSQSCSCAFVVFNIPTYSFIFKNLLLILLIWPICHINIKFTCESSFVTNINLWCIQWDTMDIDPFLCELLSDQHSCYPPFWYHIQSM